MWICCPCVTWIVALLLVALVARPTSAQSCLCNTTTVWDALKALYESTNGPKWHRKDRWLEPGSTVCEWYGVTNCGNLTLSSNNLDGTLPPSLRFAGVTFTVLDVSNNTIFGSLPPEYSSWATLTQLIALGNNITGTLPVEYSNWSALEKFEVKDNNLTGTLPPQYSAWTRLLFFGVIGNHLSGSLPPQYSTWTRILSFGVNRNHFTGSLPPEYADWTSLYHYFGAAANGLTGTLPPEYSAWVNLTIFTVGDNYLYGVLPTQYRTWSALNYFAVNVNSFTGTLPPEYKNWSLLTSFMINKNKLTGALPPEYSTWTLLTTFSAYENSLSGSLPPEYSAWGAQLQSFSVNHNFGLSGTLPPEYRAFKSLKSFSVSMNRLTGTVPAAYRDWPSLVTVLLDNNELSGTLPAAWSTNILLILTLHNNVRLSGTIATRMSPPLVVSLCNTSVCGRVPSTWSGVWGCQNVSTAEFRRIMDGDVSFFQPLSPPYLPPCPSPAPPTLAPPTTVAPIPAVRSSPPAALGTASALATAALGANAMTAVARAGGFGGAGAASIGSFVQVSSLSARINARQHGCSASSITSESGDGEAVDDEVGSFVGDNPTTLALPGRLSWSGGTVVGNALLLFVAPPVAAGAYYAVREAIAAAQGGEDVDKAMQMPLGLAVRLHLVVYAWVLAPTAAAAAVLLADGAQGGGGGAPAALGVFGLVIAGVPAAGIAVAYVRSRPLKGKAFSAARSQRRSSFSLKELARRVCADRGSWSLPSPGRAISRGRSKATPGVVSQLLQCALSETLQGCVYPHGHVFLVDFALAGAQGLLAGSALSPAAAPSCAAVRGLLWSIFGVSVCAAVFEVWVRPRATLLDEGITLVMAVWTAVVSLLSALDLEDAASGAAAAQAAVSLCCALLPVAQACYKLCAVGPQRLGDAHLPQQPWRQHDERRRSSRRIPVAPQPSTERSQDWATRLLVEAGGTMSHVDLLKILVEEICAKHPGRVAAQCTHDVLG